MINTCVRVHAIKRGIDLRTIREDWVGGATVINAPNELTVLWQVLRDLLRPIRLDL